MMRGMTASLCASMVCASVVAGACTGVYVGRKVSADGATYLAKSVDDWGMKFWHFSEVVPARMDVTESARGYFGFAWPLPKTTYRYVTQPRATQFRTGRLACGVMNEKGLAVSGAVTAWPKRELLALDPFVKTGAAEENMPDWIGPSCATAREALDLFAKVIASRGSIEGDIYMIADRREAWYLEIYTGHHWAAVRMPEDMVMTQGNEFMIDDVDPASPDFRCSPGLFDLIAKAGCAVRGASGRIHLAASCGAPLNDFHNMRTWWGRKAFAPSVAKDYEPRRRYETFFRPDGKVSMADVFRFMRSHYEGTPQCVDANGRSDIKVIGSENQELEHLQAIRADVPDAFAVTTWTALGPTEHSVFVPVPALLDRFEADWACDSPAGAPEDHAETRAVAHKLRKLATLARIDRERYGLPIRAFWAEIENRYLAEWPERFATAMRFGDHARAAAALSEYSRACQREVSRKTQELIDQLMNYMVVDVRTCRWHPAPDGYGIVPIPPNPPFEVERESSDAPRLRVGAVNWDCSLPSTTFFGGFQTRSLGPEKFRDRTPYYAKVVDKDAIEYPVRTVADYEVEMRHAIAAGVDYFAYCWYDRKAGEGRHVSSDRKIVSADAHVGELTQARLLHLKSALRDRLGLCAILVCCHAYSDAELKALAETMKEDCYEKVEGRPLVYLFSGPWQDTLKRLRDFCKQAGTPRPFAVRMSNGDVPKGDYAEVDAFGAYACTGRAETFAQQCANGRRQNELRTKHDKPVIPTFSVGWDPTPRLERPVPWCGYGKGPYHPPATEAELCQGAREFAAWMREHRASRVPGQVLVFAWNEFEEGGWICPNLGSDGRPDVRRRDAFAKAAEILRRESDDADEAKK